MAMPAAASAMHFAPVHSAPVAAHPFAHPVAPVAHPVAPHHPSLPATPRPPVTHHPVSSTPRYPNAPIVQNFPFDDGGYPVPGLGFDYVHYAAVHPNARHRQFFGGSVFPFVSGGIYVPIQYYAEPSALAEQPVETAAAEPEEANQAQPESAAPVTSATVPARSNLRASSTPTPEFIFVRRDGTVFFAVAYSWLNGNLQYVTQDGLRRIIPLNTLDLDATSQFNEQRGLSFRSPA